MNALAPIAGLVLFALLYVTIGPLMLVIALRVALWFGDALSLDDAIGTFVAEARQSFDAHRRTLERES